MLVELPKVYPILDSSQIPGSPQQRSVFLRQIGISLASAGVELLEYRNKDGTDREVLMDAAILRAAMPTCRLILDDRVDVALAARFDGVHVDYGDLPTEVARKLMGAEALIGTSASTNVEVLSAQRHEADYVAFGPIFPTRTKQTSQSPIGVKGVRIFRGMMGTEQTLVAAGGITIETAREILEAGADSVAVSAAIFGGDDPAAEFERWMAALA